ncbi:hypothetical protein HNQ59_003959, partial [Chitinivorax tropicus]|nr:hypothetical protein [Chitinivorax tropicus]
MIEKWAYPFPLADGKDLSDVQVFFKGLSACEDGFYPIGGQGVWHGGIHFDSNTAQHFKQEGVRCIADGEVVAYRIDGQYPELRFPSAQGVARYATGFVLVRHTLVLPPPPKPVAAPSPTPPAAAGHLPATPTTPPPGAAAAKAPPPKADTLIFFSLYMHLQDKAGYDAHPRQARPVHWPASSDQYQVGTACKDKEDKLAPGQTGLRIRDAAHKIIGLIPQGAQLRLGGPAPNKKAGYVELLAVLSGGEGGTIPTAPAPGQALGYVYQADLEAIRAPAPAAVDGIHLLPQPINVSAGALLGHLGTYQHHQHIHPLPNTQPRPLLHLECFAGDDLPAFLNRSRDRAQQLDAKQHDRLLIEAGVACYQPQAADLTLSADDRVVETTDSPKRGQWAKARRLVRQIVHKSELTDYQPKHKTYRYQGQTVSFTGRFIGPSDTDTTTDSQTATRLGYNRREIWVANGDPLWLERTTLKLGAGERRAWSQFPLQTSQPSPKTLDFSQVYSRAEVDKWPANRQAEDDRQQTWRQLSPETGWICEQGDPKVRWQTKWHWPGFDLIEEHSSAAEQYSRQLDKQGQASSTEA